MAHRHPPAQGSRAYLHAVIDNFSRRILAWRVAETFTAANSVAVLVEAGRGVTASQTMPVVFADAGVENANAQVDELITTGVLRRVLALTELKFSNSMIEAWWRSLKHQWLFLHSLDSVTTIRRLVAFYVQERNTVLPHSAFRGQTPDDMYFGKGDAVPADLTARAAAARQARIEATDRRPAEVPVHRRGCVINDCRPLTLRARASGGTAGDEQRAWHLCRTDSAVFGRQPVPVTLLPPENDGNSRTKLLNVREFSSARPGGRMRHQCLVPGCLWPYVNTHVSHTRMD
jgi:hypothetical protein